MKLRRTRTLVVWGLRESARVSVDGPDVDVQLTDPGDRSFVDGFVAGLVDMPRLDFARRLWSGRLAEFLGPLPLPGTDLDAFALDVALRGLGFRRRTERAFRARSDEDRSRADAWAAGVNAWIDQTDLPQSPTYARLGSRPRLLGAADAMLLQRGATEIATTHAADTSEWPPRVRALWAALTSPALTAPGAVGEAPTVDLPPVGDIRPSEAPRLTARTVLDRDDRHLFVTSGDAPRRLYVDRPDVAVRGGPRRRPWIRRAPEGWLVSDALQDADGPEPPAGDALVFEWPHPADRAPPPAEPHEPLDDAHPWRIHAPSARTRLRLELVPKRG